MRTHRSRRLATVALAALTVSACGSTATHVAARPPAPPKLSLTAAGGGATAADSAGASSVEKAMPAIYPQQATTYVLDRPLADLGATATVRKLVGHEVDAAEVARIGAALGMHGTPTQSVDSIYTLTDGNAQLTVQTIDGATSVDYSDTAGIAGGGTASSPGSAGSGNAVATPAPPPAPAPVDKPLPIEPPLVVTPTTTTPPVDVPSGADAEKIAQSLLDDLGALDGQQWKHEVSDTEGVTASCAADGPCAPPAPSAVTARTVTYQLLLDGAPVPGVTWWVTIGDHGRVQSLSGTWATPRDAGSYALRSTKSVFDDLQHGRGQYAGVQAMDTGVAEIAPEVAPGTPTGAPTGETTDTLPPLEVHITGVALGATRWEGSDGGRGVAYLVPTYRFHATAAGNAPYDIELLALVPASFTIVSPPPVATPGGPGGGPITGIVPQPAPAPEPVPTPPDAR